MAHHSYISFIVGIKRLACLGLLCIVSISAFAYDAKSAKVFLRQQSTFYSETSPISLYKDDLRGGDLPDAGENAVTYNSIEFGMAWADFELSVYQREDYALRFTDETFFLIYRDKNKLPIPEGQDYDVLIDVNHVKANGLKLGYSYHFGRDVKLKVDASYLNASDLLYGKLSGFLSQSDERLAGDLIVDYDYETDVLFGRDQTPAATGKGYALDWRVDWEYSQALKFSAFMNDALAEITWDDAPYTEAQISSSRTYIDANGEERRAPIMSGRESFRRLSQSLPRRHGFAVNYHIRPELELSVEHESYEHVHFNRVNLDYRWRAKLNAGVGVDFTSQSLALRLSNQYFRVELGSDSTDFNKAKLLVLNMQLLYAF